ncbi:MAG TPA: nucleoside-diphosphate sugar epimerase, partial [Lachnospiraceae bacterium]|nr:nucleoside-diphosphate sugar epimerase [Lachnospiraceae bacterium]
MADNRQTKKPFNYAKFWRRTALILYDIMSVILSCALALLIRYEFHIAEVPEYFYVPVMRAMPLLVAATIAIFWFLKLYNSLWAFAGETELQNLVIACVLSGVAGVIILPFFKVEQQAVPQSFHFMYVFLLITLTFISRFSYRFLRSMKHRNANK